MPKYIFLDNWVLSDSWVPSGATKEDKPRLLAEFIRRNNYTIIINSALLTELYNPGWEAASEAERTLKAVHLFSQHPCVIVDALQVFAAEIAAYPAQSYQLPIALDLADLPVQHRAA